ncbi:MULTISPECIES: DUF6942 family protein [unclassified Arsukibacterium]|uniref:DUF6942 family protein n=1 Tax=unclassified Arsukibacterium TaxID=2635278 RepID=UPI000C3DA5DC|nr:MULTISPECIES: hypothetical protein [unclassified Arsukibacterium]MAA94642.1 hypothetical protein [Rheinheimera sp.]MBM32774.1 hypothetical protein [Rheinheimera sp.]HAW93404.1 hypothetical protein [Candidatus Azambacteria bacterium]|tara:strand:- start:186 stop:719 length:534 start_codon:yes stop_codon:yes gene_type:complete
MTQKIAAGFGDNDANINVYIANRPPMAEYAGLCQIKPLLAAEIELINSACGNGWRKVFNVYSKLLFALDAKQFSFIRHAASWQQYRDQYLLQAGSNTALLFSSPAMQPQLKTVHIIAGRTHAKALLDAGLPAQLTWLNNEFAIDKFNRLLVCPYFDYRQLNNEKLAYLAYLIKAIDE